MSQQQCPLSFGEKKALALAPHVSYAKLDSLAGQAVQHLRQLGLKRGDCIALRSDAEESTIALLFAAWRLSLIVALIPPRIPFQTMQHYLEPIHPELIIEDSGPFFVGPADKARELEMETLSLLLLTSASSGTPKWAAFTLNQLFESAKTVVQALDAKPRDRWLLSLPLHHVGGLGVLLRALLSGGTMVIENKELPYPARFQAAQARFASLVPTQLYRLIQSDFHRLSTQFLIGGAPLTRHLYEKGIERDYQLLLTYALTEMGSTIFLTSKPIWNQHIPYLGHPLPGRKVKILEHELLVSGPCLFTGYGREPYRPGGDWFATGDLGIYHEQHGFAIRGRKDFQFISGGENIQPEEVESAILSTGLIEQAIVVPLYDEEFGARPVAFVKTSLPDHQIRSALEPLLPKYKIPIVFTPYPESENLKPNRLALIQLANKIYN